MAQRSGGRVSSVRSSTVLYAWMALVSFVFAVLILSLMIWKVETLVAFGLVGRVYYVVLLAFGLAVAFCLFGVLKSVATYRGEQLGGRLELGGPFCALVVVVILAFWLVPDQSVFPLTVFVHGSNGPQDIVLRNEGEVFLDLAGDRRHEQIGDQGQAYFPSIPANFRGQSVLMWVSADGFESVNPSKRSKLDASNIYLPVQRKAGRIYGGVRDSNGACVPNTQVRVAGLSQQVESNSCSFDFSIPGDRLREDMELEVMAPNYAIQRYKVVPNANAISVVLYRTDAKTGRP